MPVPVYTNPDHYYTSGFECCPHRSGHDNASATNVTSTPTAQGGAASNSSDCATAADEAVCGRTPGCAWQLNDPDPRSDSNSGDCVAAGSMKEMCGATCADASECGSAMFCCPYQRRCIPFAAPNCLCRGRTSDKPGALPNDERVQSGATDCGAQPCLFCAPLPVEATNVTSTPTAQGGEASNISDCATAEDEATCGRTPGCAWQRDNQPFDSGDCVAAEADAEAEAANSTSVPTAQGGKASNTSDIDLHVWGPTCSWKDGVYDTTQMGDKPVDQGGTEEARCHQEHHWVHSLLGRSTPDWAFGRASGSR